MAVFKKKSKDGKKDTWTCKFYYTDYKTGKKTKQKKKEGFATQREAKAFEREFLEKLNPSSEMLFKNAVELYYKYIERELKPTTIENKKYLIETKILPYFGEKKLGAITSDDINAWHDDLKAMNFKPTYIRSIRNQFSSIANWNISKGRLDKNPILGADTMGKKQPDEEMKFYTLEEFNLFIASFKDDPTLTIIYKIFFYAGIRLGELLALKPNDFNFEKSKLRIDENLQRVNGEFVLQKPKTKQSIRTIGIPKQLSEDIKEYLSKLHGIRKNDLIFHVSKSHLGNNMKIGAEKAGIKKIRVHDLRHSNASLLLEQGIDHILISKCLGHHSTRQLYETYAHFTEVKNDEVASMLDSLYS